MFRLAGTLTLVLLCAGIIDSQTPKPPLFVVIFSLGPNWDADKPADQQRGFREHSANLQRLRTGQSAVLGGRYSDKGMVIIQAADEAAARGMFSGDEMVRAGVFRMELYPFAPFYTGCIN